MESDNYKTDKLAIIEQQQMVALEKFNEIESVCQLAPTSFLKKNFELSKIRDRKNEPNFKFMLVVLWSKVTTLGGLKNEIDPFMAEDVNRMLLSLYSDLTLEEVYKAFELERHGAYEEKTEHYQLFNAEWVSSILKKYRSWKTTARIQYNISNPQIIEETKLSPEQEYEALQKASIRLYNEFRETNEVSIPCFHVFDFLYEGKFFPANVDYQKKYEIAKFQIEKELKGEKSLNRQERNKIEESLKEVQEKKNPKVLLRAKQLVLKDYFTDLKEMNMSMEEILNY